MSVQSLCHTAPDPSQSRETAQKRAALTFIRWTWATFPPRLTRYWGAKGRQEMKTTVKYALPLVGAMLIHGCAVAPLNPAAQGVRIISEDEAKGCRFLDAVSANNQNTLSKNPEEDARNRAKNRVAELGGNTLRIKSTNNQIAPSGVGSIFSLSGEAYKCN